MGQKLFSNTEPVQGLCPLLTDQSLGRRMILTSNYFDICLGFSCSQAFVSPQYMCLVLGWPGVCLNPWALSVLGCAHACSRLLFNRVDLTGVPRLTWVWEDKSTLSAIGHGQCSLLQIKRVPLMAEEICYYPSPALPWVNLCTSHAKRKRAVPGHNTTDSHSLMKLNSCESINMLIVDCFD